MPALWVFSVDETSVQVMWRLLAPGTLDLRCGDVHHVVEVDGGPGTAVVDGLPAGAQVHIRASGSALDEPTVLTTRTLDPLPGQELCRIATLSDLHVGTEAFGHLATITEPEVHEVAHPQRCADAAIDEAVTWGANHLVIKGDLTHAALPGEWRTVASIVARSPIPVDAIPGNHDQAPPRRTRALAPGQAAAVFGFSMADPITIRDLPGVRLVLADSTINGTNHGSLALVADLIVDAAAEAPRDGAVLVVLHHQLQPRWLAEGWPPGIGRTESIGLVDRLAGVHPNVLVTSGHTHRNRRWERRGVVATQVGSTKDYPGVWAGYRVHEGGISQVVRRVARPDCVRWTDHSRRAAFGLWEHLSPGRLEARCFTMAFTRARPPARSGRGGT